MRYGPRRRIVAEEEVRPDGTELSELFEVLSCGHRQPVQVDEDGLYTAEERCCRKCRDKVPVRPIGEVLFRTDFQ